MTFTEKQNKTSFCGASESELDLFDRYAKTHKEIRITGSFIKQT